MTYKIKDIDGGSQSFRLRTKDVQRLYHIGMPILYKRLMSNISFFVIILISFVNYGYKVTVMNLHEECLLRYLQNPDELSYSTQILKLNNYILEKQFLLKNFVAKSSCINYTEHVK